MERQKICNRTTHYIIAQDFDLEEKLQPSKTRLLTDGFRPPKMLISTAGSTDPGQIKKASEELLQGLMLSESPANQRNYAQPWLQVPQKRKADLFWDRHSNIGRTHEKTIPESEDSNPHMRSSITSRHNEDAAYLSSR